MIPKTLPPHSNIINKGYTVPQSGNNEASGSNSLDQRVQDNANFPSVSTSIESKNGFSQLRAEEIFRELGPVKPKYVKREEDGDIKGALDVENDGNWSEERAEFARQYNERYGQKHTAAEVVVAGFTHAFNSLLALTNEGKVNWNRSIDILSGTMPQVLYREIIFDLLMGARLHFPTCNGFELLINDSVNMVSSKPERVLRFKERGGVFIPIIETRFMRHSDFCPDENSCFNGVDPVSAKWIIEQFTQEEMEHLLNLLREPAIENTHPELMATVAYMKNAEDPRVKLVETAYSLIADMGLAIGMKFGTSALISYWQEFTNDYDAEVFAKEDYIVKLF